MPAMHPAFEHSSIGSDIPVNAQWYQSADITIWGDGRSLSVCGEDHANFGQIFSNSAFRLFL
jgi:hypothetical protein